MLDEAFLFSLGLIVSAAAVISLFASRIGVPSIVSYLIAGILLGPVTHLVEDANTIKIISETGIVLLLFLVGLELTFEKIRNMGKLAVGLGSSQVLVTVIAGYGVCRLLGYEGSEAWIVAAALMLSSTVVVVKTLVERKETESIPGRAAVGVLLIQDLVVIILLTLISALGSQQEDVSLAGSIAKALGGMVLLLVVVLGLSRVLTKPFDRWATRYPEMQFIWSLSWCFLVVMATHWLHLSHEIGAFVAGVSLAQMPHSHDLQRRVQPLMNFFVAVFFVSLGIAIKGSWESTFIIHVVVLSLFVLFGKFLIIFALASLLKFRSKHAFTTALLMTQISEFSFIFATLAAVRGFLDWGVASLLGVVGLVTILISALAMANRAALYRLWCRTPFYRKSHEDPVEELPTPEGGRLRHHVIIVGANTLGSELARRLHARGEPVIVIDIDATKLRALPCPTLTGDAATRVVLEEAGFEHARVLVSTLHIEATNDLLAYRCKAAGIPSSIHAVDMNYVNNLLEMDVRYLMVPKVDGIKQQNEKLKEMGFLGKEAEA